MTGRVGDRLPHLGCKPAVECGEDGPCAELVAERRPPLDLLRRQRVGTALALADEHLAAVCQEQVELGHGVSAPAAEEIEAWPIEGARAAGGEAMDEQQRGGKVLIHCLCHEAVEAVVER